MRILKSIGRKKKRKVGTAVEPSLTNFAGIQINSQQQAGEKSEPTADTEEERRESEPTVGIEEERRQRKNLAIQDMFAKNANSRKVAFRTDNNNDEEPKLDEMIFDVLCLRLEDACGVREDADTEEGGTSKNRAIKTYKIVKDTRNEMTGLSFVAFKGKGGILVCKIKEGSKFNGTGLKVGMRVVSINGTPCPERVRSIMKMLKKVEKELVLEVEDVDIDRSQKKDELELTTKGIDQSIKDDEKSSAMSRKKDPYRVDDRDDTAASSESERNDISRLYDSDSDSSSSSWTQESSADGRMDNVLGKADDRSNFKRSPNVNINQRFNNRGENYSVTDITKKIKDGAPLWMFFE